MRAGGTSGVLLTLALGAVASAAPKVDVTCTFGWDGCYRPSEWTPLELVINSAFDKPVKATLSVAARQDSLNTMTIRREIVFTPNRALYLPLVTKLAADIPGCKVRIEDDGGRTLFEQEFESSDPTSGARQLIPIAEGEMLIGVIGRCPPGLRDLPQRAESVMEEGRGRIHVRQKFPHLLPWDWTGYAALDLLVMYDLDLRTITPYQARAIVEWVQGGGRFLIVMGSRPLPGDHPIAQLVPFKLDQARQVRLAPGLLGSWGLTGSTPKTPAVACWLPEKIGAARGWSDYRGPGCATFGPVGFGMVGVVGFDPSVLGEEQPVSLAAFWVEQTGALVPGRRIRQTDDPPISVGGSFIPWNLGTGDKGANLVLAHILSIPEMRPLSIWWLILILSALAMLLGPVDYLVLKRLDRLPLTWVTSGAWIVLFTVVAYYGVEAIRGGGGQVRAVSVVDGVEGAGGAWSTVYSGIFAPTSDTYRLQGLKNDQWWSCIAPRRTHWSPYDTDVGSRDLCCIQSDGGGNLPSAVPISIWSMQTLICESRAEGMPFSAVVEVEADAIKVQVVNHSDIAIRRGSVRVSGDREMEFAEVPGKGSATFTGRAEASKWEQCLEGSEGPHFNRNAASFAHGSLHRTRSIEAYLKTQNAALVCAEYDEAPAPFELAGRKAELNHIRLARLVVFPKEERP